MTWSKNENIRDAAHWISRKIELIELKDKQLNNNINPKIKRGGIFNIELGEDNIGGEKNKKRPCLIISNNTLNNGFTVIVIPITTKFPYNLKNGRKSPKYDNHYILLKSKYKFLDEDSCLKCEDIRTVDKVRIMDHLGNVDLSDLKQLKKRIMYTLEY